MNYNKEQSIQRCFNILTEYGGLDEFIKRIEESINESYSKEQCYKDVLENADFNTSTIFNFIKHSILSDNNEDIEIIARNINVLNPEIFSYLIEELKEDTKCKEFLKNEIKNGLVRKQDKLNNYTIFKFLKSEEDGNQIIEEVFEDFLSNGYDYRLISTILEETEVPEAKAIENKEKILNNAKGENIILFIKWFDGKGKLNDDDIELEDFVKALHSDVEDKITLKMLEIIYKELMDKQRLNIRNIELLGKGVFNSNYRVGQFVLKIGQTRETKTIPYHRRILQPIIRQDTNPNKENNLYIEIQNVVDNKWYEGMTEEQIQEELYKIYKEMRNDGIVWTDIKKENIGRLIKPNRTNYYTETLIGNIQDKKTLKTAEAELKVSDNSVGIFNRREEECLQPGEFVILDTDFLFKEEDIDIEEEMQEIRPAKYIRYEQRYRYELEKEKEQR